MPTAYSVPAASGHTSVILLRHAVLLESFGKLPTLIDSGLLLIEFSVIWRRSDSHLYACPKVGVENPSRVWTTGLQWESWLGACLYQQVACRLTDARMQL